jgi:membrane-associated phospholipid phosphatase
MGGLLLKCRIVAIVILSSLFASAQNAKDGQENLQKVCGVKHLDRCFVDLAHDQAGIWTSPLRIQSSDAVWLVPFAGATGAALYYDADAQRQLGINKSRIDTSQNIARFGSPYATVAAGVGMYALGAISKDQKLSETGRLGTEAVINASIITEAFKLATNRERPDVGLGTGRFWPHGTKQYFTDGSFPSGHAAASWALARVITSEYPGWLPKLGAYGFATVISISRVTGRNHFPSDALVGTTFGYLIGGYVYRHHSAEFDESNALLLTPNFDQRTRSYGARIELPASALVHPVRTFLAALR